MRLVMAALQRSNDEWWWCRDDALQCISSSLSENYIAIVDDFLPVHEVEGVCAEVGMNSIILAAAYYVLTGISRVS